MLSYGERLSICSLELLELRRLKRDLLLVYKIRRNHVGVSFGDFFEYAPQCGTRGHSVKLYPKFSRTNRGLATFANRVVNVWNSLPEELVLSRTVQTFRRKLDSFDSHLRPFLKGRASRDL